MTKYIFPRYIDIYGQQQDTETPERCCKLSTKPDKMAIKKVFLCTGRSLAEL